MKKEREVLMLAGQVREHCTNMLLTWGRAVVAARKQPENKGLEEAAKLAGLHAQMFAVAIVEKLG